MLPASAMSGFNSFSTGNVNLQITEVSLCKMLTWCYLMGVLFVKTPVRCVCVCVFFFFLIYLFIYFFGLYCFVLFCFVFSFVSFFLVGILLGFLNIVYSTVPVYH